MPQPAGVVLDDLDDYTLLRTLFKNYRGGNPGEDHGLCLSLGGLAIMASYFQSYHVPVPEGYSPTAKHLLYFDRVCSMPWYLDDFHGLVLFEAELAMRAKLVGDIDALLTAFEIYGS